MNQGNDIVPQSSELASYGAGRVYDRLSDALHELREQRTEKHHYGVNVTKEVHDAFDPMEHLDLAVFMEHTECCGFGDNRTFDHLEVVDRASFCRWNEERKDWVPYAWELSWHRPSETVLRNLVRYAKAFYRRPVDADVRGDQNQITHNQITHRQEDTE